MSYQQHQAIQDKNAKVQESSWRVAFPITFLVLHRVKVV